MPFLPPNSVKALKAQSDNGIIEILNCRARKVPKTMQCAVL